VGEQEDNGGGAEEEQRNRGGIMRRTKQGRCDRGDEIMYKNVRKGNEARRRT
jgi:hypothetical protein